MVAGDDNEGALPGNLDRQRRIPPRAFSPSVTAARSLRLSPCAEVLCSSLTAVCTSWRAGVGTLSSGVSPMSSTASSIVRLFWLPSTTICACLPSPCSGAMRRRWGIFLFRLFWTECRRIGRISTKEDIMFIITQISYNASSDWLRASFIVRRSTEISTWQSEIRATF